MAEPGRIAGRRRRRAAARRAPANGQRRRRAVGTDPRRYRDGVRRVARAAWYVGHRRLSRRLQTTGARTMPRERRAGNAAGSNACRNRPGGNHLQVEPPRAAARLYDRPLLRPLLTATALAATRGPAQEGPCRGPVRKRPRARSVDPRRGFPGKTRVRAEARRESGRYTRNRNHTVKRSS